MDSLPHEIPEFQELQISFIGSIQWKNFYVRV